MGVLTCLVHRCSMISQIALCLWGERKKFWSPVMAFSLSTDLKRCIRSAKTYDRYPRMETAAYRSMMACRLARSSASCLSHASTSVSLGLRACGA